MKRLLSILLSLTLVFSLSAAAGAETAEASVVQTQVLVIGGGGAGISAAIAAAEQGAQVLLIEKLGYLGGATIIPVVSSMTVTFSRLLRWSIILEVMPAPLPSALSIRYSVWP